MYSTKIDKEFSIIWNVFFSVSALLQTLTLSTGVSYRDMLHDFQFDGGLTTKNITEYIAKDSIVSSGEARLKQIVGIWDY